MFGLVFAATTAFERQKFVDFFLIIRVFFVFGNGDLFREFSGPLKQKDQKNRAEGRPVKVVCGARESEQVEANPHHLFRKKVRVSGVGKESFR